MDRNGKIRKEIFGKKTENIKTIMMLQILKQETWGIVNNLINDLLDNNDIELQTPIEYVVGYICKGLLDSNNLNRSCQKKNNKY